MRGGGGQPQSLSPHWFPMGGEGGPRWSLWGGGCYGGMGVVVLGGGDWGCKGGGRESLYLGGGGGVMGMGDGNGAQRGGRGQEG